jgi:hypothetical protein
MQLHSAMMVTRNFYQVERPQLSYLEGRWYRRRAVLVLNCKGLSTSECFRSICRIRTKYRSLGQYVCLKVILVFGHDFVLPKQQSDDLCVAYTSIFLNDKDFLYKFLLNIIWKTSQQHFHCIGLEMIALNVILSFSYRLEPSAKHVLIYVYVRGSVFFCICIVYIFSEFFWFHCFVITLLCLDRYVPEIANHTNRSNDCEKKIKGKRTP